MAGKSIWLVAFVVLGAQASPALAQRDPWTWVTRYYFDIDPKTPVHELLPTPPPAVPISNLLVGDLALVPEVQLAEPYLFKADEKNKKELEAAHTRALLHIAQQVAKINVVNKGKTDAFMERLVESRPDLRGLPFTLGQSCRLKAGERAHFRREVFVVGTCLALLQPEEPAGNARKTERNPIAVRFFWAGYDNDRLQNALFQGVVGVIEKVHPIEERQAIAALMQMLGPESSLFHAGLIERLAGFEKTAAGKEQSTQALARLAVFSREESARTAATAVLQKRPAGPATAILLQGLRYPWPDVARNAADAIAQLKRNDLIPELVKILDEPDPRAPKQQMIDGKKAAVVRELVRINHHRNCLLCHPPGNTPEIFGKVHERSESPPDTFGMKGVRGEHVGLDHLHVGADFGPVPVPGEPFPLPSQGYGGFGHPDILIRADATYLRQDFSMMQKVPNAHPWPEAQRFDYLVRSRVVGEQEAEAYRAEFAGQVAASPYRQAALSALRRLTGQDAGTTGREWREALKLP